MQNMKKITIIFVAISVLCLISQVKSDLISHYPFDTDANDVMGLRPGVFSGSGLAQITDSNDVKVGTGALEVAGFGYVDLPGGAAALNNLTSWTICAWVKVDGTHGGTPNEAIFVTDTWNNTDFHAYYVPGSPNGKLEAQTFGGVAESSTNVPTVPTGWFHYVAVRDGATIKLYLNGLPLATAGLNSAFTNLGNAAAIGASPVLDRHLIGLIDDVRIYNHALTAVEIQALPGFEGTPKYTLTVLVDSPGTDPDNTFPPPGANILFAGTIALSAPRFVACPEVLVFDHWLGDVADPFSSDTTILLDQDKTITAVYVDGRQCGDECHGFISTDFVPDCIIDLKDLAVFALDWLACNKPECDGLPY